MKTQFTKKDFDIRAAKIDQKQARREACFLFLTFIFLSVTAFAQSTEPQNEIAPELVGKWCFINLSGNTSDAITNSCITLNADGTFEAVLDRKMLPNGDAFSNLQDSDYGKWWVSGNRIYYSSTSNGQSSFAFQKINHPRLDNTPMIVINGIAFATVSSHDPW